MVDRDEHIRLFLRRDFRPFRERRDHAVGVHKDHRRPGLLEHAGDDPGRRKVKGKLRHPPGAHRPGLETVMPDVQRDPQALEWLATELRLDPLGRIRTVLSEEGKWHAKKRDESDGTTDRHGESSPRPGHRASGSLFHPK